MSIVQCASHLLQSTGNTASVIKELNYIILINLNLNSQMWLTDPASNSTRFRTLKKLTTAVSRIRKKLRRDYRSCPFPQELRGKKLN